MADYAQGNLRSNRKELEEALHGFVIGHHHAAEVGIPLSSRDYGSQSRHCESH